jgi:hypothetical protein
MLVGQQRSDLRVIADPGRQAEILERPAHILPGHFENWEKRKASCCGTVHRGVALLCGIDTPSLTAQGAQRLLPNPKLEGHPDFAPVHMYNLTNDGIDMPVRQVRCAQENGSEAFPDKDRPAWCCRTAGSKCRGHLRLAGRLGSSRIADLFSFCRVASRPFTRRNVHPRWDSPVFNRIVLFVVLSKNIATPSLCPVIAPTRARGGRDGETEDCRTRELGRRFGEKIGRFLVALNEDKGIAHNGLACPTALRALAPPRLTFVDTLPL